MFAALCGPDPVRFLRAHGAERLDVTHLEYARLARSLRDLAVRIDNEVDLDGVNTWGFDGLRRVAADIVLARRVGRRDCGATDDRCPVEVVWRATFGGPASRIE